MTASGGNSQMEWTKTVRNVLGWIVGAAVGSYSGINLLVPLGITGAAWWSGKKVLRPEKLPFLPAISVQTGHLLWLSLGALYLGTLNLNLLDVVVLVIGLAWLIAKPGLWPIIFLTVFQVLALAVNAASFMDAAIGTNPHKALLVHIIWRVIAVFLMWRAYVQTRANVVVETAAACS
jgi:hypothetical protein